MWTPRFHSLAWPQPVLHAARRTRGALRARMLASEPCFRRALLRLLPGVPDSYRVGRHAILRTVQTATGLRQYSNSWFVMPRNPWPCFTFWLLWRPARWLSVGTDVKNDKSKPSIVINNIGHEDGGRKDLRKFGFVTQHWRGQSSDKFLPYVDF
jgi:hypothetical protein